MAETCEVQALEKISTEVDESQIKVILSTQCIKAQAFLVNKLRKQAERSKERCSFISSANLKLQSEITQAQQEIKSMLIAQETINMANVELKKELLIAKEKKLDVSERVKKGEKKYEDLWLESKARYESLPFVQSLIKAKDEVQNLEQKICKLENEAKSLIDEIGSKKEVCFNLDRKRIIELAEFLVNEMPKIIAIIKEKSAAIKDLTKDLENLHLKAEANVVTEELTQPQEIKNDLKSVEGWRSDENNDNILIMPKLQLGSLDVDDFSIKLDQVKISTMDAFNKNLNATQYKNSISLSGDTNNKMDNNNEYISSYFKKPSVVYEENKNQNYAKMKLINILEDIKIDKNKTLDMMAKVNVESLRPVEFISVDCKNTDPSGETLQNKENTKPVESEKIEEIDLTNSDTENLLVPPTQFLDMSAAVQNSQGLKKQVSFDLPHGLVTNEIISAKKPEAMEEITVSEAQNSQLNISAASDEGFAKLKDMIIKKHNLDLSPQFVYAKNVINPLILQKSEDIVTSKFFQHTEEIFEAEPVMPDKVATEVEQVMEVKEIVEEAKNNENCGVNQSKHDMNRIVEINVDTDMVPSPKKQKMNEIIESDKTVSGFLFSHGAQIISDSLDGSINTTGFEDGDADFPHCLDSSLLLSPKADILTPEQTEVLSQEVPNFLSGLRKTGLSFFGCTSSEPKSDTRAQNQGGSGFNFNFRGEEKKHSGGLFSMFQ